MSHIPYGYEVKDGKIHYTLTKQLTGVEVLNYTAKVKSTNGVDDQVIADL